MSVIIRLQNLPWNANALDIRRFFQGLSIPDGGVHIIGGEKGDAFIAFSTDEDARQAMMKDGGPINGFIIKLFLSSKTEMQNVISTAKTVFVAAKDGPPPAIPPAASGPVIPKPVGFYDRPVIPPVGGAAVPFGAGSDGRGNVTGSGQGLRSSTGFGTLPVVYPANNSQIIPAQPAPTLLPMNELRNVPAAPVLLQPARSIFDTRPADRPPVPANLQQPPVAPMETVPGLPPAMPGIQPVGAWSAPQPPVNREPPPPDFGRPADIPDNQSVRFDGYSYNAGVGREPMRMDSGRPDTNFPRTGPAYGTPESGRNFVPGVELGRNLGGPPPPDLARRDFGRGESDMPFRPPEEQRDRGRFMDDRPSWAERDAGRPEGGPRQGPGWGGSDRPFGGRDISNDSRRDFARPDVDHGMRAPDRWFENRNMGPDQGPRGPDYGSRGPDQGLRGPDHGPVGPDYGPRGLDQGPRGPDYGPRGRGLDRGPRDFMPNEGPPPRPGAMEPDDRYGPGSASRFGPSAGPHGMGGIPDSRQRDDSRPAFMHPEPGFREPPRPLMDKPIRLPPPQPDRHRMEDQRGYGSPRFEGRPPSPSRGHHFPGDGFPPRGGPWRDQRQDFDSRQMKDPGSTCDLCVCVTNMPTTFNYREARRSFPNCQIPHDGVKLINDRMGLRTGVVFLRFQDARSLNAALNVNGKMINDRRINVERCSDAEFDNAVDGAAPAHSDRSRSPRDRRSQGNPNVSHYVLKKLPKKTEKDDIRKFFGKFRIASDGGPFFELAFNNSRTGNALIALEEKDVGKVLKLNHNMLNGTAIDVIKIEAYEYEERSRRCRQSERDTAKDAGLSKSAASPSFPARDKKVEKQEPKSKEPNRSGNAENDGRQQSTSDAEPRSYCVEMRGVPYTAAPPLIQDFFRDITIPAESIHIVYNREHRATGIAYVEFNSSADQQAALAKNKQHMGHRVIDVRSLSKLAMEEEYNKQVQKFGGTPMLTQSAARSNTDRAKPGSSSEALLSMQNLHFDTQLEDILDFFTGHRPIVNSIKLQYRDQQPTGDGLVAFASMQEAESALRSKNRHYLLGKIVSLSWAKK